MYSPNTNKKYKNCLPYLNFFPSWWKYFLEYLREVETELEDSLECDSGAYMGSIYEKNQMPKYRATVPLTTELTIKGIVPT